MIEDLVKKAKKGDSEAFSDLIKYFQNDLYKVAKCRLEKEDDVLDALQETIISAFNSIKNLSNIKAFKPWIIKILINNCNAIYRENKDSNTIPIDQYDIDNCNASTYNISSNIEFESLISVLSQEEKTIMVLYYSERYTTKEISKILKVNESTIRSKILRIKKKLKIILEEV